jgi:hypothetical protein
VRASFSPRRTIHQRLDCPFQPNQPPRSIMMMGFKLGARENAVLVVFSTTQHGHGRSQDNPDCNA